MSSISSQFISSNYLMENQFKQLSAPSIISSTALPSNLSSSGTSSSRYVNQVSNNFWDNYEHLCALQNVMPMQSIKACLSTDAGSSLNIMADKLKTADWDPLLSALRVSKNFKNICFHSNFMGDNDSSESARMVKGYAKLKKPPAIRNKEKTNKLCRSLKDCLSVSTMLNKLELFNIPLSAKDCSQIAKGLRANKTVKYLSLDRCTIGDEGLAVICKEIQNSSNLNRVNFSACNLTHEGANILATLIKVQALKRHNEAWKDSLRYGRPDLDSMFGIRRITINSNQLIGDEGVKCLADAFKSDLWLKALDLQECGITTEGANYLLDGLKFNAMMHVLDVRLNVEIDRDTLQKIMEQVMINSSGNNTDYEWMPLTATTQTIQSTTPKKIKKRRNTNTSFTKKPQVNTVSNTSKLKRCKSTGSVICNKSPASSTGSNKNGIPWRTAARANRFRVSGSCAYRKVAGMDNEDDDEDYEDELIEDEEVEEELRVTKNKKKTESDDDLTIYRPRNYIASSTFDYEKLNSQVKNLSLNNKKSKGNESIDLDKIKNSSVKELLNALQKEQESKTQLEDLLLEFQDENNKLKSQISVYKSKMEQQQQEINRLINNKQNTTMNRTTLDDDKALEIIELTLYKYQNFLDFLRNAGYGKLIDMGETHQNKKIKKQNESILKLQQQQQQKQQQLSKKVNKSPKRTKSPHVLNDQQKYFLNKINKTKQKLKNEEIYEFYNSSRINEYSDEDGENHDIDTLLSNALEISRSFRRFNSSSINNSTMYNNYNQRRNNDVHLSEIEETKENSNLNESEFPSFMEVKKQQQRPVETKRLKKQAITTASLKSDDLSEEKVKSNSSATTVINANSKSNNNPAPKVRTSIRNSLSETSRDKEIEVEDVSEILSEEEHSREEDSRHLKSNRSNETISAKSQKKSSINDEDDDDF